MNFTILHRQISGRIRILALLVVLLGVPLPNAQAAEPARPLVVGHRGLMHSAPECTLAAFRACLALRFGFEFDVRRCKDGTLVCLHDPTLDRTTDGRGALANLPFDQLRKLDAGSKFDRGFRGQRVPRIDEIFTLVAEEARGDILCAVDLKESGDGLEENIVRLAESRNILSQLLFIGVTIESADVRSRLKEASDLARTARLAATPEDIGAVLADPNADWVYVRFLPSPAQITRIHAVGKRLFVAGPIVAGNESANWSNATEAGINAILTDYPMELAAQLRPKRQ